MNVLLFALFRFSALMFFLLAIYQMEQKRWYVAVFNVFLVTYFSVFEKFLISHITKPQPKPKGIV